MSQNKSLHITIITCGVLIVWITCTIAMLATSTHIYLITSGNECRNYAHSACLDMCGCVWTDTCVKSDITTKSSAEYARECEPLIFPFYITAALSVSILLLGIIACVLRIVCNCSTVQYIVIDDTDL